MRAGEIIASLGASGCGDIRPSCPQSLLSCHFGEKNKDLVQSLRSLWQSLEHCPNMHPTPTYEVVGVGHPGDQLCMATGILTLPNVG